MRLRRPPLSNPAALDGHDPAGMGVDVRGLHREFRVRGSKRGTSPVVALAGIDLSVPRGEIHGLLGPNGAGKTTLCKILSTVLLPSSGIARVAGYDVVTQTDLVRRHIGIVFGGDRGLYPRLTARENMQFWAALHHEQRGGRVDELLDRVGLLDRADHRVEIFSRGMKQRLHIARALVGNPQLLLLDEPTTGMDPVSVKDFRAMVGELRSEGRTILLTTHNMDDAQELCDRVSLIDAGRILATERPATLGSLLSMHERVEVDDLRDADLATIERLEGVSAVSRDPVTGRVRVQTCESGAAARVIAWLGAAGYSSLRSSKPSLNEVYLHFIGDRGMRVT